jgi:hypothetical protein
MLPIRLKQPIDTVSLGMEDYPANRMDFDTRFTTEEACQEYLFQLQWSDGFQCPQFNWDKAWATYSGLRHCAACGHHAFGDRQHSFSGHAEAAANVVSSNVTGYFQNNTPRMYYPAHHRQGLPTTSTHTESFVKEINARAKGTEKFCDDGTDLQIT